MCETVAAPKVHSQAEVDQADGEDNAVAEQAADSENGDEEGEEADDAAAEGSSADPPSTDEPESAAITEEFDPNWLGGELNLRVEDAVRVQGLVAAPQHNGKEARVEKYHPDMGGTARYEVRLLDDEELRISVRPANLEVLTSAAQDGAAAAAPAAAAAAAAAAAQPTTATAPAIADDVKARIEKNRQIAMAKREARRLSQQQAVASPNDSGMGAFFQSSPPALASLNYDVPAAPPVPGAAAPDPVATELSFEEELAKAVEAAEATLPAPSAGSQDEQFDSLPVEDVSEPQDAAPPSAEDMSTDNPLKIDAAEAASAPQPQGEDTAAVAPAPAPAEEEDEQDDEQAEQADFIVADEWEGEHKGYYFGTGPEGPGYFLDRNAPGDVVPPFQTGMLTETLNKWVLGGGDEPNAEKVKLLEPHGWLQAGTEGGFETQLTREQFQAVGVALKAVRSTSSTQAELATQSVDAEEEEEDDEQDQDGYETADEDSALSAQHREEAERVVSQQIILSLAPVHTSLSLVLGCAHCNARLKNVASA